MRCIEAPMSEAVSQVLPISVSLIACNEGHRIGRCLESVAGWTKDIVAVINDCTDATESILQAHGATVIHSPWQGFREQKNQSLQHCLQPWVLALDADEAVSPELRRAIEAFFAQGVDAVNGAEFSRKVWLFNRWITHGDYYPDVVLRLFRNGCGHWAGDDVHTAIELQGKRLRLHGDLLHYTHSSINAHVRKTMAYADDFADRSRQDGRSASLLAIVIRPPWRFFRSYVLRLGFLDGLAGYYIAVMLAFYTFLRYSRLYEEAHELKLCPGKAN